MQFLVAGIVDHDEPGVFVTFEERPREIARNFRSFGWDVDGWQDYGQWTFVDASPDLSDELIVAGGYDLSSLVARVRHAVEAAAPGGSRSTPPDRSSTSSATRRSRAARCCRSRPSCRTSTSRP